MKTKVISISNQKGGVGKTTTTANLGYVLAKMGKDVLLIDYDSQASLTNYLNVGIGNDDGYYGIYEMLIKDIRDPEDIEDEDIRDMDFEELFKTCVHRPVYYSREVRTIDGKKKVVEVPHEFGLDLLPSDLTLSDYELELNSLDNSQRGLNGFRLYNIVQRILQIHEYDYILIDCNPSLSMLTMQAIFAAASGGVLIPTNLDLMSTRGVENLINTIANIQEGLARRSRPIQHMGVIGIILNLFSERRKVDRTIQNDLERYYPFRIFTNTIPESVRAKDAVMAGVVYSQSYTKAEEAYTKLAEEIFERIEEMEKEGPKIYRLGESIEEDEEE